jgi:hypothetical protein
MVSPITFNSAHTSWRQSMNTKARTSFRSFMTNRMSFGLSFGPEALRCWPFLQEVWVSGKRPVRSTSNILVDLTSVLVYSKYGTIRDVHEALNSGN